MESFNLNIIPGKTRPVCHASQFDTGRVIRVNLFEDANIYTLSGSEEVSLSVRKPDGNVVTVEIENTGDSFVEIVTTEQMTACAGSNLCELKIENDGKVIGTMNFILETEQDPLEGGIESQSSIYNLETQVNGMVTDAVADQYDSNAVIFDQEPTAGHGNGYAVTSEAIKAAIDDVNTEVSALDVALQAKQNANDAALTTTSKNVAGAINELNAGKQEALGRASLPAGTDLNDVKTVGFYWVLRNGASHMPVNEYGVLEVVSSAAGTYLQRFTRYGADTTLTQNDTYVRLFTNGQWYQWGKVGENLAPASFTVPRHSSAGTGVPASLTGRKTGNVCQLNIANQIANGTYTNLWQIPEGYRPVQQFHYLLAWGSSTSLVTITTDGTIKFNNSQTTSSSPYLIGCLTWICS